MVPMCGGAKVRPKVLCANVAIADALTCDGADVRRREVRPKVRCANVAIADALTCDGADVRRRESASESAMCERSGIRRTIAPSHPRTHHRTFARLAPSHLSQT